MLIATGWLNEFLCSLMLPIIIIVAWIQVNQEEEDSQKRKKMYDDINKSLNYNGFKNFSKRLDEEEKKKKRK